MLAYNLGSTLIFVGPGCKFKMDVSVIMTCHNEAAFVEAALRSVVSQSSFHRVREILLVNDGSTDDSASVLSQLAQEMDKLRVIVTSGVGVSAARNLALAEAVGGYIAFLDGDDIWSSCKLERQLSVLESCASIGLVYGDFYHFTKNDLADAQLVHVRRYGRLEKDLLKSFFIYGGPVVPSTMLLRREVFADSGYFDTTVNVGEDADMCLRIAERWQFEYVSGGLAYKRSHANNATRSLEVILSTASVLTERCIARNARLAPYATKRMARRYAIVGNDRAKHGERLKAIWYLAKSLNADPLSWRTYAYLTFAILPPFLEALFRRCAVAILQQSRNF